VAKKKENRLTYLQMPLPEGRKAYKMTKRSWSGLNYRQTIDTGALSMEENISTLEAPYLVPSQKRDVVGVGAVQASYPHPIGIWGFDDFLLVLYSNRDSRYDANRGYCQKDVIQLDYLKLNDKGGLSAKYTGYVDTKEFFSDTSDIPIAEWNEYIDTPRSIVQFNVYDTPTDTLTGKYIKKLLIYPDCKSMDFEITTDNFEIKDMNADVEVYTNVTEPYLPPADADTTKYYKNTHNQDVYKWVTSKDEEGNEVSEWKLSVPPGGPELKYATVHLSRVFGVDNDRVYASGYNDYSNWNLDTVEEYNEANAWCSPAQSNTKAGGAFTGITTFQNHVICFKRDFMHEIYNTKNPFRLQDIYAEGTIDNRTVQDVDGKLIFVSDDDVKIYTGSNPRIIGYNLNMKRYTHAVSGNDGRNYYLYCEDGADKRLFVYDTYVGQWSEQSINEIVLGFAHNKHGMYMLCKNPSEDANADLGGKIYRLDTSNYNHRWSFETDLITNETVDIKHIRKLQMFAHFDEGAELDVYILYDDEKFDKSSSHLVYSQKSESGQKAIRVKPRQTASYGIKLHIEGYGYVKLYEMEIFMENGGDLYVGL
jgi:hypothetical protein